MDKKILELMSLAFETNLSGMSLADCSPYTVYGWNSLSLLNLVSLIEEAFDVSLDIDEISEMARGGSAIAAIIREKIGDD